MAEYFPLIDRAITGLPESTAESRRAIYERARAALIGQLRKTEPAVPEEDIARESAALDEAIARVEAKFKAPVPPAPPSPVDAPPPASAPVPPPRSIPPSAADAGRAARPPGADAGRASRTPVRPATPPAPNAATEAGAAPRRSGVGAPGLPIGKAPPIAPPPARERPVLGPAPTVSGEARPGIAPARPLSPNRPGRPTPSIRPGATGGADEAAGRNPASPERPGVAPEPAGSAEPSLPPAADLAVMRPEPTPGGSEALPEGSSDTSGAHPGEDGAVAPSPAPVRIREPSARPAAPRPAPPRRFGRPAGLVAALVAIVMIGVGVMAWRLRDRPEDLAKAHPAVETPGAPEAGKIVDRAPPAQDGADGAPGSSSSGVAVPAPVGQNGGGDAGPALAVAQRAALLVDAPDEPQKIKTYSGTVVWHLDSVSPGQNLPLVPAIKADVDIPDAKLKVTMVMQPNLEPQLPASHTIEVHFFPQPGYALGNVLQINVPELRKDDAPSGDALTGVPVTIDANNFLVGLSRGGAEGQNKRLIIERNWFDVSVLFAQKRPGKLTFEKGIDGQRLWDQAFAAWGDAKAASGGTP